MAELAKFINAKLSQTEKFKTVELVPTTNGDYSVYDGQSFIGNFSPRGMECWGGQISNELCCLLQEFYSEYQQ